MIGFEDAHYTYEYEDHFKILPAIFEQNDIITRVKNGVKVPDDFTYCSNTNDQWMDIDYLRQWVSKNVTMLGTV